MSARPRLCAPKILSNRIALQTKPNPHLDLELQRASLADRAANRPHLEPVNIAKSLLRLSDRVAHRLLHAIFGHSNDFDYLVSLIRHDPSAARAPFDVLILN